MQLSRRRTLVLAAIASLVAMLGVQAPALADSVTDSRLLTLTSSAYFQRGAFGDPWKVGDCHLENPSYVAIDNNNIFLHGTADTDFTKHADVWHSRFDVLDASFNLLVSVGSTNGSLFDSPPMKPLRSGTPGPSGIVQWNAQQSAGTARLANAFYIRWISAC